VDEQVPEAAGSDQTTARLRERSARLTAAATAAGEVSHRASTNAGGLSEIAVIATGLGRVSKVQVGPKAVGSDPTTLGATLVRLLNEAIAGAREKAAKTLGGAAEPGVRKALLECAAAPEVAEKLAGETFSAASPDETVTVTASGTGEITGVRLAAAALSAGDGTAAAEQISAAANAAIDAAQHRQRELSGSLRAGEQDLDAALDAQLAAFNKEMDELLGRINQAGKPPADEPADS
jgi:DNA-binding protein YbaB